MFIPTTLRAALACTSVLLLVTACGGGGQSPASLNTPQVSTGTGEPVTQAADAFCGTSEIERFCNATINSPAPQQRGTSAPVTGENGVGDCDYTGSTGGDSTNIAATVFIPPHNEGETMPLLLHSHGWGGSRAVDNTAAMPETGDNTFIGLAEMIPTMVDRGYLVISYDQRGWGGSEGQAAVIDPCFEAVDAIAILDWAAMNLPVDTSDGDMVVGAIGGSYGGAYQMMLAQFDDRLDAIMPVATWNSLADPVNELDGETMVDGSVGRFHGALVTNEVVKRGYVTGLCALANTATRESGQPGATLDPVITQACAGVLVGGAESGSDLDSPPAGNPNQRALFAKNGMANLDLRTDRPAMDVDVWLVQGMRDMVFDGIEAFDNYQFFSDSTYNSGDVRLTTTDGGHMLTTFELANNNVNGGSIQIQGDNDCGPVEMFSGMISWMDEKLKCDASTTSPFSQCGQPEITIPEVCIALDSDDGVTLASVPVGNSLGAYEIAPAAMPVAVNPTSATNTDIIGSPRQFLPLATMMSDGYLAGVPILATLKVEAPTAAPTDVTAFIAVGIQRGSTLIEVDEQVTAIRRSNSITDAAVEYTDITMPMVGDKLLAGDVVGLLLYQRHGQFQEVPGATTEYATNAYNISGTVELPIHNDADQVIMPAL